MPSAEEDHDHDLPRRIGRCHRHHHRWLLRTVNAKTRKVQRHQQHRVPNSEPPAASALTHIASIREADRHRTKGDRHCRKCHHWRTSVVTPIIARAFSLLRVLQLDTKKTKEIKNHRRCRRRHRQRRHHHLHRCSSSSSSSSSLRLRHLCLESLLY